MSASARPQAPLNLGVLISGGGTTLENLIGRMHDGRLPGVQITRVISSRRAVRGVEIARDAALPLTVIRPQDHPDAGAFSRALTTTLDESAVHLAVLAGFLCHWQIPDHWLGRALNIHPALLPKYGGPGMYGLRVHQAVIAAGERESGCTVHLVDEEYDHGPLVAQSRVPVRPDDTPATLAARVGAAERELYPQVIRQVAETGLDWLQRFR